MLKKILASRYFPTLTKPVLTGLIASGVVFGLHAFGITDFTSNEVNAAIAPLVGFAVAAVVSKPKGDGGGTQPPAELSPELHAFGKAYASAYVQGQQSATPTLGKQVASLLLEDLTQVIDSNPQAIRTVASTALEALLAQKSSPTAATQPGQPRSNYGAVLAPDTVPTESSPHAVMAARLAADLPTEQGYPAGVNPPTQPESAPTPPPHF
jgi:hypothetical protein